MEIDTIVTKMIAYWVKMGINTNENLDIKNYINYENDNILSVKDFNDFYRRTNGMPDFYPNDVDDHGFLFLPLEKIVNTKDNNDYYSLNNRNIFIFISFLQESWLYGVEIESPNKYTIGVITNGYEYMQEGYEFTGITNSLYDFINYYLKNDDILYIAL